MIVNVRIRKEYKKRRQKKQGEGKLSYEKSHEIIKNEAGKDNGTGWNI